MVSFKLFTAVTAFATSALAHPANEGVAERAVETRALCKSEPSAEFLSQAAAFANLESTNDNSTNLWIASADARLAPTSPIQTYIHVVASSNSLSGGYIPQSQVTAQFNKLNSAYAPYGISFVLAGTDYTVNPTWAADGNELAMKKALRKGSYSALNLYFLKLGGGTLGYCYFPTTVSGTTSNTFIQDGCSILYTTVPGGSASGFNLGLTAVHEIGHWLGLLHTFQGNSCTGSGDQISDTPAQLSPTSGCPTGRDSCPSQAGLDPINNYMDYSSDACYSQFTSGQMTRVTNMWNSYRAGK